MPFVDINEKLLSRPLADCHTVLFYSTWGLMWHIHSQQMGRDAIYLNASFIFLVKVCLMGPKQDILHVCTNICFSRRTNLVQHCPARTLANKAATASLANVWGRGSCTDGSQAGRQADRRTRTSRRVHEPGFHWSFSGPTGHICSHTERCPDFHSMHGSVTDLKRSEVVFFKMHKVVFPWKYLK